MVPALREEFNRNFTAAKYQSFLDSLGKSCGTPIQFRVSETPCFLPKELLDRMLTQLSPKDRLLVTLLHLEERSAQEIHLLTGWSRAAIKIRAFRARAKMKKMLSKADFITPAFAS